MALAITTPVGVVIHTGDFKVDPTPTDNELFDLHTLADYGKRGVPPAVTYQRIWDVRAFNPNAFMPLYGPNAVLTEQEIKDVMAFLQTGK